MLCIVFLLPSWNVRPPKNASISHLKYQQKPSENKIIKSFMIEIYRRYPIFNNNAKGSNKFKLRSGKRLLPVFRKRVEIKILFVRNIYMLMRRVNFIVVEMLSMQIMSFHFYCTEMCFSYIYLLFG